MGTFWRGFCGGRAVVAGNGKRRFQRARRAVQAQRQRVRVSSQATRRSARRVVARACTASPRPVQPNWRRAARAAQRGNFSDFAAGAAGAAGVGGPVAARVGGMPERRRRAARCSWVSRKRRVAGGLLGGIGEDDLALDWVFLAAIEVVNTQAGGFAFGGLDGDDGGQIGCEPVK